MRKQITASAFVAALLLLGATQYTGAADPTILTSSNSDAWGDKTVNSNATNTPDIALLWGPPRGETGAQWGSYGDLGFNMEVANPLYITFTPDAAHGVKIESFDMKEYPGYSGEHATWTIKDSSGTTLGTGDWTSHATETISPDITGAVGMPLTLTFTRTAGSGDSWSVNNIAFSQVVPEPATLGMLAFGAIAALRRRRRA